MFRYCRSYGLIIMASGQHLCCNALQFVVFFAIDESGRIASQKKENKIVWSQLWIQNAARAVRRNFIKLIN